jgi:hypothetical protein
MKAVFLSGRLSAKPRSYKGGRVGRHSSHDALSGPERYAHTSFKKLQKLQPPFNFGLISLSSRITGLRTVGRGYILLVTTFLLCLFLPSSASTFDAFTSSF